MFKIKFFHKVILQIIIFIIISTNVHSKNTERFYEGHKISNYFSGILSLNDGEYASSLKFFKNLNGLEDKHYIYSQSYLYSLTNTNRLNESFKYSKKLKDKKLESFESDLIIGIYYLKNNQLDLAKEYFKKKLKKNNQNPLHQLLSQSLIVWTSLEDLEFSSANKIIDKIDPRFTNLKKIQTAFLYCYYDKPETAEVFNKLSNDKSINFSRYDFFHANYLKNKNKNKESLSLVNQSLTKFPKNLILNQLKLDLKSNKEENYKNNFDCKKISHNLAELFYITANALASENIYPLSNFYLNLAKFLNPNFISYDILIAENFYINNKLIHAKKNYEKIKLNGRVYDWFSSKKIVSILILQKKNDEAVKFLTKNFEDIKEPTVYEIYDFADFLKNNKKFDQSIEFYSKVLENITKEHELYSKATDGRGVAFERIDQWEKAEVDLLNSLKAKPNQAYVINYLAYTWIEKGIKINEALTMLEKANDLKKNNGYITDSLGWALFRLQKYEKAKVHLKEAVKLMPSDPVINDHYGDSLWMNGDKLQARYYWNYVLGLEKAEEELKIKIENKLIFGPKLNT